MRWSDLRQWLGRRRVGRHKETLLLSVDGQAGADRGPDACTLPLGQIRPHRYDDGANLPSGERCHEVLGTIRQGDGHVISHREPLPHQDAGQLG
jgi:hypothetical protein